MAQRVQVVPARTSRLCYPICARTLLRRAVAIYPLYLLALAISVPLWHLLYIQDHGSGVDDSVNNSVYKAQVVHEALLLQAWVPDEHAIDASYNLPAWYVSALTLCYLVKKGGSRTHHSAHALLTGKQSQPRPTPGPRCRLEFS